MTIGTTAASWEEIIEQIKETSNECERVATILSKRAAIVKTRKKILRAINIVVGAVAFIVGIILPDVFGQNMVKILTAVSSIALFVDGLWPSLFEYDPPERLQDYSYYIRAYAKKFKAALLEDISDETRKAKVLILHDLANNNINQVKTMWPWVEN